MNELDALTLAEVLSRIDAIPDGLIVYLPEGEDVGLETRVTVLSLVDVMPRSPAGLKYRLRLS
jgi:hypothetical protein